MRPQAVGVCPIFDPVTTCTCWLRTSSCSRSTDPVAAARKMNSSILHLFGTFVAEDGKAVDYAAMAASGAFVDYVNIAAELAVCLQPSCAVPAHVFSPRQM